MFSLYSTIVSVLLTAGTSRQIKSDMKVGDAFTIRSGTGTPLFMTVTWQVI